MARRLKQTFQKRTFDVCLSIGMSGYIRVEAHSEAEAKRMVREIPDGDFCVELISLSGGPALEFTQEDLYERLMGSIIDHAEIDAKVERRR